MVALGDSVNTHQRRRACVVQPKGQGQAPPTLPSLGGMTTMRKACILNFHVFMPGSENHRKSQKIVENHGKLKKQAPPTECHPLDGDDDGQIK